MTCAICGLIDKNASPPLYLDDEWIGISAPGNKPGWAIIATRRHSEWLWGMTPVEATGFGPAVARLSEAIRNGADADRVYLVGMGDTAIHCHFMLIPRSGDGLGDDIRAALKKAGAAVENADLAAALSARISTLEASS